MRVISQYCQKCRTANVPGEELCLNCGTRLMLVTIPSAMRYENTGVASYYEEHLLERISLLELRLSQISDKLGQSLDLMLRQSRTIHFDHILIETLIDALTDSGIVEGDKLNEAWREKIRSEGFKQTLADKREKLQTEILAHPKATKTGTFTALVKEGLRLFLQGKDDEGLTKLERAAILIPDSPPLLAFLGEQHFRSENIATAREFLHRAQVLTPQNTRINLLLGLACAEEGDLTEAEKYLAPLLENEKLVSVVGLALGFVFAANNRWTETLVAFRKMLAASPSAENHYLVASTYTQLGREKLALRHLQKAVETDVNYADAWFMLGSQYLKRGDELSAKDALTSAISAKDAESQCLLFLKNPKRYAKLISEPLVFLNLAEIKNNLLSGLTSRLNRIFQNEMERILAEIL